MTEYLTSGSNEMTVDYVHLTIHMVSGGQYRFVQTSPEAAQGLLEQLRPERIFAQKQILIAGTKSVTVLPTESIERIDLRSAPLPDWPRRGAVNELQEITEEDFGRILRREIINLPRRPAKGVARPPLEIGVSVELRSGAMTYVRVHPSRPRLGADETSDEASAEAMLTPDDAQAFLRHLFDRPVLFGVMEDAQGIFLINPTNAVRFVISPPPPVQTLPSVWHAESESETL